MKRDELQQIAAYSLVGLLSVAAAFIISVQFVGRGHAQSEAEGTEAPPAEAQPTAVDPMAHPASPPSSETAPPSAPPPPHAGPSHDQNASKGPGDISELEGFLEPFIYDMVNRRDPFQAWAEYVAPEGPSKPLSPAQRFDLDQLSLVGILWDVKDPKAMFMDPDNEVIVLGRDEGIGNKNGYIASIREGEVVVVEASRKRGDLIYKTRTLRIER